jgi:hypothetical protein
MSELLDAYLAASEEFEKLAERISELGEKIRKVGVAIASHPGAFRFTNSDTALPAETLIAAQDVLISASEWPHAGQIMELQRAYQDARIKTRNAWDKLPENLRSKMQLPPPGVLQERSAARRK